MLGAKTATDLRKCLSTYSGVSRRFRCWVSPVCQRHRRTSPKRIESSRTPPLDSPYRHRCGAHAVGERLRVARRRRVNRGAERIPRPRRPLLHPAALPPSDAQLNERARKAIDSILSHTSRRSHSRPAAPFLSPGQEHPRPSTPNAGSGPGSALAPHEPRRTKSLARGTNFPRTGLPGPPAVVGQSRIRLLGCLVLKRDDRNELSQRCLVASHVVLAEHPDVGRSIDLPVVAQ